MNYNFWSEIKTKNNLDADLVISSLQKHIRRGFTEKACASAYELYITSPLLLQKMWRRLLVISVEDIGFGNIDAASQIKVLYDMAKEYPYDDGDQPMYFIHAIRILSESNKDRSSDYLKNIIIKGFSMGEVKVEIPDVAYDKHTKKGEEMGRDSFHFFHEGAKVIPQLEVENNYKNRYLKILERYYNKEDKVKLVEDPFKFNSTQY